MYNAMPLQKGCALSQVIWLTGKYQSGKTTMPYYRCLPIATKLFLFFYFYIVIVRNTQDDYMQKNSRIGNLLFDIAYQKNF